TTPIADKTITLQLNNVPLYEALRYVTELAGLKIKVEPYAVSLVPISDVSGDFITKEYRVPAGFIPPTAAADTTNPAVPTFGTLATSGTARLPGRADAKTYLESQNIPFPPGASATYIPAGSKLVVRNTLDNIDLIDAYISAQTGGTPTQVEIESRFVEITQNDLKELGFDWLVGPFAIGSSGVYGTGGSGGGDASQFPFQSGGSAIGSNSLTSGLRSGSGASPDSAVTVNSLDALLAAASGSGLTSAAAPALFGLSGIFTNPQFQVVIRGLDQRKGVDLMTAPKVTTKSGLKASVKIAREFIYPTEFDPPQIPQETDSATVTTGAGFGAVFQTPGAITPSNPGGWTTQDLGVTLGVTPTIGPDNYTIDLEIEPEVVDFDGFINYGSPINAVGYRPEIPGSDLVAIGTVFVPEIQVLTQNVINQPIFTIRKITTTVTIWDGQTVALGGLIREDVQKVQDKVPFLGDIPFAGRLFRSNVDQKIKRNLIVFVTAKLIDAQGQPLRREEEEEEIVEPVGLPAELPKPQFPMKGGK
ncbi:MAG TPA: type II and III secretion system protein, partial [Chthoniobacterales bacterium]